MPLPPGLGRALRFPAGLLAALLAAALAVAAAEAGQAYVLRLARAWVPAVAPLNLRLKADGLAFQRAALRDPALLPVYGTSELYCCAAGENAPQFFLHAPTGFRAFAVGYPLTADLFFAQDFAALGRRLAGRRVVVSDSWWFMSPGGIAPRAYDHTFSPEVAATFAFDSPIPVRLKGAIARRMLDYPESLRTQPLLRSALADLAAGTPLRLAAYYALLPLGRLDAWALQLRDAWRTWSWIRGHRRPAPHVARQPRALDWTGLLARASRLAAAQAGDNPFGLQDPAFVRGCRSLRPALALYASGRSNRLGRVYGYPAAAVRNMLRSRSWDDLALELRVLRALGARPLVWTMPLAGVLDDYTPWSLPARQRYYRRYESVARAAGVPALTFRSHDEDRYFMASASHMSARGWIFADRALDLFWHGASLAGIRQDLAALDRAVPPVGPPAPPPPSAPPPACPPQRAGKPSRVPAPARAGRPGRPGRERVGANARSAHTPAA